MHRVYCVLRLNIPRRTRRRIPRRMRQPLVSAQALNTTWALDFMVDTLYDGRRFRTLNIIDESNREGLAIEIGTTLPSLRVIAVLEELIALHGPPQHLRADNGPELTSLALTAWCEHRRIKLHYIQPGKPQQNAFIERFNPDLPDRDPRRLRVSPGFCWPYNAISSSRQLENFLHPIQVRYRTALRPETLKRSDVHVLLVLPHLDRGAVDSPLLCLLVAVALLFRRADAETGVPGLAAAT